MQHYRPYGPGNAASKVQRRLGIGVLRLRLGLKRLRSRLFDGEAGHGRGVPGANVLDALPVRVAGPCISAKAIERLAAIGDLDVALGPLDRAELHRSDGA